MILTLMGLRLTISYDMVLRLLPVVVLDQIKSGLDRERSEVQEVLPLLFQWAVLHGSPKKIRKNSSSKL